MTRPLCRAALAGVIALASTVALAGPASAHEATIEITSPTAGTKVTKPTSVTVNVNYDEDVDRVRLVVEQLEPVKRTFEVTGGATAGPQSLSVPFSRNGKYRLTPRVEWTHPGAPLLGIGEHDGASAGTPVELPVAIPPAPPAEVRALVNAETRVVTVTWNPNGEEDMLGYVVLRARAGGQPEQLANVEHPKNTFVDSASAEAGGEYTYQVLAVRRGATENEPVASTASVVKTGVPDPPPPPTTAPPAGAATTVAGTTATTAAGGASTGTTLPAGSPGALATSGKVDLSGFTTIQGQARRSVTPRTLPEVDTGFQGTLPFDVPEGEEAEEGPVEEGGELGELAADSPQFRELGAEDDATDRQRSLAFLAAGLLATVLLMHVLWVKSEVEKVPLEPVAPDGPQPTGDRFRPAPFRPAGSRAKVPPMAKPPKTRPARFGGSRAGSKGPKLPSGV